MPTRSIFHHELQMLQEKMLMVASEVEKNVLDSVTALRQRNAKRSQEIIHADEWINAKRIEIGMECLGLISTQQPVATDMRIIAAMFEIGGELERIHDYAKGIGKINLDIDASLDISELVEPLPEMAQVTRDMLHRSMTAFTERDAELAWAIPLDDDRVDALFNKHYRLVLQYLSDHPSPESVEDANRIQWAGHNLERAADRVINICEWIIYIANGKYLELDREIVQRHAAETAKA
jgi:phosphate transport system protein